MEFQTHGISALDSMAMVLTLWFANSSFGGYQQSDFYIGRVVHGSDRLPSVCLPGDPGEISYHLIWDLWWTELYWDSLLLVLRFFRVSIIA
jgi:hypothetical protein